MVSVRRLQKGDVAASSRLHRDVLDMEFLAQCGDAFLRCYHRAWIDSADGMALAAVEDGDQVVGVLLGALHPDGHFRSMVRHHGGALAFWLLLRALTSPRFAKELLATRVTRYARGLIRMLRASVHRRDRSDQGAVGKVPGQAGGDAEPEHFLTPKIGEVTHVMVRDDVQGKGVGRAFLDAARRTGQQAGLDELVLVTPPDLAARAFYERLGWQPGGELRSRSGEEFVRYYLPLQS